MTRYIQNVLCTIKKHNMITPGDKIVVGLSGGADSCALLHILHTLSEELNITLIAAHLNHGIRGSEAQRDMDFSKTFAQSLGVEFVTETLSVPDFAKENKISEETAGRQLRYAFFNDIVNNCNANKIAVAHNENDRAETVFMNLMRGCGANGFGGIKPCNGNIIRPLIDTKRSDIESYCLLNNILYVTDSTNKENIYTRNKIRNEIFGQMYQINPNVVDNIIRTSDIITEENHYMNMLCEEKCPSILRDGEIIIEKQVFDNLDYVLKRRVVLNFIEKLNGSTENISMVQIQNAISVNQTGKKILFPNGISMVCTSDSVIFTKNDIDIDDYEYKLKLNEESFIPEIQSSIKAELVSKYTKEKNCIFISADDIDEHSIIIRSRKNGDEFSPSGFNGTKKVKKFFIDCKIPQHKRNLYPLLVFKNEILAILPLRVSEKHKITHETQKILKIKMTGGTYE